MPTSKMSAQIEADKRLLSFTCYEDYLDSLIIPQDLCFLQSNDISRSIVELGYRSSGETVSRAQFQKRLAAVKAYLCPPYKPYELASDGMENPDRIHEELGIREQQNRYGNTTTIIFLRCFTKSGFEISGYIDYSERIKSEDWKPFFQGTKRILPRPTDLGFYNWRTGKTMSNDSDNFKVLVDPVKGLLFQNRFDRKVVCVDPSADPGELTTRKRVISKLYEQCVLFDHLLRQPI